MSEENETRNWVNENTENTRFHIRLTVFLNKKRITGLGVCYTTKANINQTTVTQLANSLECDYKTFAAFSPVTSLIVFTR